MSDKIERKSGDATKDKPVVKKTKEVTVTFRENRKYDLHVGRNMITFLARETKKIPADWLKHPDWKQASKLFVVKGV